MKYYLLALVVLEHTVGVEHGSIMHFTDMRAWFRSLGDKEKL